MDEPEVIEEFYGVYLLYCLNEKYIGKTYIGYTTDPNRRINQHNKGSWAGGARKTSNKGPWKMVMIIHGFPNNIAALRFEWAWQNPEKSRRLLHVENKKKHSRNEKQLCYRLRILSEMLRVGPWNRLPLTIRWLAEEFSRDFLPDKLPPLHMPICYGPVKSKKVSRTRQHNLADGDIPIKSGDQKYIGKTSPRKNNCHAKMKKSKIEQSKTTESISCSRSVHRSDGYRENAVDYLNSKANRYGDKASYSSSDIKDSNVIENDYCENIIRCGLCYKLIQDGNMKLTCLNEECDLVCHMYCLAELFLESGEYVPIEGDCPFCTKRLLWGDLIRKLKGCQDLQRRYEGNLSNDDFSENEDDNSDLSGTDLKNQSDTSMRSDKIILNLSDSE